MRVSGPRTLYTKEDVQADAPQLCTVVEVHREHLWYRVQFETGYCACYKMPGGDS